MRRDSPHLGIPPVVALRGVLVQHEPAPIRVGQRAAIGMASERSAATRLKDSFSLSWVDQHAAIEMAAERSVTTRCKDAQVEVRPSLCVLHLLDTAGEGTEFRSAGREWSAVPAVWDVWWWCLRVGGSERGGLTPKEGRDGGEGMTRTLMQLSGCSGGEGVSEGRTDPEGGRGGRREDTHLHAAELLEVAVIQVEPDDPHGKRRCLSHTCRTQIQWKHTSKAVS